MLDDDLNFELSADVKLNGLSDQLSGFADAVDLAGKKAGQRLSSNLKNFANLRGVTEEAVQAIREGFQQGIDNDRAGAVRADVASADPSIVRAQVTAANLKEAAQRRYNQLLEKEQDAQRAPLDYRRRAMEDIADQMRQQQRLQQQAIALDDPVVLRERLKLVQQAAAFAAKQAESERSGSVTAAQTLGLKQQIATIEHESKLASLSDQMNPDKIRRQVAQENQLLAVEKQLRDLREQERDRQSPQAPLQAVDFRAEVLKQETETIKQQTVELERQRVLLDPSVLQKRLEMERQLSQIKMDQLRAEADPSTIRQRVEAAREEATLRQQIADATAKEHHEQSRPGVFQKLLQDPAGAMSDMKSKAGGFFKDMKDEFGKGGMGGILDKVLGGGGAGGKSGGAGATNVLLGGIMGGQGGGSGQMLGQLGGILGEAIGGPAGAMVGEMAGKAVQAGLEMPAKAVAGGFKMVDSALKELGGELGPIGLGFSVMSGAAHGAVDAVSAVSPALGAMIAPLAEIPDVLGSITSTLTHFAAKANPASFRLFEHAVDDSQAVIGQRFVPVLELMTDGVRLFADVLTTILPDVDDVRASLSDLRGLMMDFRESLGDVAPVLKQIAGAYFKENMRQLSAAIYTTVKPLEIFIRGLNILGSTLSSLTGLNFGFGGGLESSVGAAARPAQYEDSDRYRERLQLAAYSQGQGPTQAQLPSLVQQIHDMLRNWTQQWSLDAVIAQVRAAIVPDFQVPELPSVEGNIDTSFLNNFNPFGS